MQNGTPLHALQELGACESSEMVRRFVHFSAEHLVPHADRLCALQVVDASTITVLLYSLEPHLHLLCSYGGMTFSKAHISS